MRPHWNILTAWQKAVIVLFDVLAVLCGCWLMWEDFHGDPQGADVSAASESVLPAEDYFVCFTFRTNGDVKTGNATYTVDGGPLESANDFHLLRACIDEDLARQGIVHPHALITFYTPVGQ